MSSSPNLILSSLIPISADFFVQQLQGEITALKDQNTQFKEKHKKLKEENNTTKNRDQSL
jgi:hypothetical protein